MRDENKMMGTDNWKYGGQQNLVNWKDGIATFLLKLATVNVIDTEWTEKEANWQIQKEKIIILAANDGKKNYSEG